MPNYKGDKDPDGIVFLGPDEYRDCPVGQLTQPYYDLATQVILSEKYNFEVPFTEIWLEVVKVVMQAVSDYKIYIDSTKTGES